MSITITVEDGSVVTGANSYISLADFKTYCDDRGYDYSASDDEVIKAALIRAGQYLNDLPWKGMKTARANPMSWPRYGDTLAGWNEINQPASEWLGVVDSSGYIIGTAEVPVEVIYAQCEAAWVLLLGKDLEPNLDRGGQVKREKYEVVEWEYFSGAPTTTEFRAVSNRLTGLLVSYTSKNLMRA